MLNVVRTGGRLLLYLGLLLVFVSVSVESEATVLRYLSAEELVSEADEVVHGRVISVEPRWTANAKAIYTEVVLEVIEVFKGDALGGEVTFTFLGGERDGVRLFYENKPAFTKDEEVLVFLRDRPNANPLLMALSQGVWRLKQDDSRNLDFDPQFVRNLRGIGSIITNDGSIGNFEPRSFRSVYTASEMRGLVKAGLVETRQTKREVAP